MERKMSKKLLEWKNDTEKTPLILYGARQVGKTYTILSFGKENYKNIRQAFLEDKEFSLHSLANEYYRLYLAIGGMPRAILEYKEKQDMDFVTAILKDINNSYIADMAKYATSTETTKIMAVYNIISAQLAKENKKFQYKLIKSGARAYEYETAINWLNASGIINQCTKINEGKLPLSAFIELESFKII